MLSDAQSNGNSYKRESCHLTALPALPSTTGIHGTGEKLTEAWAFRSQRYLSPSVISPGLDELHNFSNHQPFFVAPCHDNQIAMLPRLTPLMLFNIWLLTAPE